MDIIEESLIPYVLLYLVIIRFKGWIMDCGYNRRKLDTVRVVVPGNYSF